MFDGHLVVITGAAGGFGVEAARAFGAAGARLALVDRDPALLDSLRETLIADGLVKQDAVRTYAGDVADAEAVTAYYHAIAEDLGPVHGLFNNAGIAGALRPTVDYPLEMFDAVMNVNVRGVWLNMQCALRAMRAEGKGGVIVNSASGAALVGNRNAAPYAASKHAVLGLTRSAALEVAAEGIRVNAVCPGPIDTAMMRLIEEQHGQPGDAAHQAILANIPAQRYGTAEEVARLVLFLMSNDARYINGAAISIDGGLTAQ